MSRYKGKDDNVISLFAYKFDCAVKKGLDAWVEEAPPRCAACGYRYEKHVVDQSGFEKCPIEDENQYYVDGNMWEIPRKDWAPPPVWDK